MSIRKKLEEAVRLLLARLDKAKEHILPLQGSATDQIQCLSCKFNDFKTELQSMTGVLQDMEREMNMLRDLEKELDDDIFKDQNMKAEVEKKLDAMTTRIRDFRKSNRRVDSQSSEKLTNHDRKWGALGVEKRILEREATSSFLESFHCLSGSDEAKMCSLCLSVFPMNSVIEKKPLIYWWMGEGLVMDSFDKTAEEAGEQVFQELLDEGFIRPSRENKSMSVKSFVVDPWIHRMLILIAKENLFADFSIDGAACNGKRRAFLRQENDISGVEEAKDLMMVFNVNNQYLGTKIEWLKRVEVLQMGRWQSCVTHHIEVEHQELLDTQLGTQKHLKYLSLRGISRIVTLPDSISNLISLQILDLRACHNLEKLPTTISRLKRLTHLDVSHCYLLESMPKGVEQLVALQVIKGFVIGKADKNSCKISDLKELKKLRKLSIRMGKTQQDDQLGGLDSLPALHILTISWGGISSAQGKNITLPKKLTKLDLRCVPFDSLPDWLSPARLPSDLAKLYIRGGRLKSLDGREWNVKYLRFNYLKDKDEQALKINAGELGNYKYLDQFDCYELVNKD